MLVFIVLIGLFSCSQEPTRATQGEVKEQRPPAKEKVGYSFSIEDCKIFVDCACAMGDSISEITKRKADKEQCQAGRNMLSLGDMTQACALARKNLKQILKNYEEKQISLNIEIPPSCEEL